MSEISKYINSVAKDVLRKRNRDIEISNDVKYVLPYLNKAVGIILITVFIYYLMYFSISDRIHPILSATIIYLPLPIIAILYLLQPFNLVMQLLIVNYEKYHIKTDYFFIDTFLSRKGKILTLLSLISVIIYLN